MRIVRHGGKLDNVGIEFSQALVNFPDILRCLMKIVIADNPFGLSKSWNRTGDVFFEIHVVDPLGDCRTEQHQPLLLALVPLAAILLATAGDDDRTGPIRNKPLQIHGPHDVIDAQFNELGALFRQMLMLGDHHLVPAAANTYCNHSNRID